MTNHDHIADAGGASIAYERLESVRTRRVLAFLIDYVIVGLLVVASVIPVFILGLLTFGLGWLLFPALGALIAIVYVGLTMGGPSQATLGMAFFSLRIEALDGGRIDFLTAVVHAVLFWAGHVVFTPLLLVVSLLTEKKQLIHDVLLGTVIVRTDV